MAKIYPKSFVGTKLVDTKDASLSITSSAVLYGLSVYSVFPVCVTKKGLAAFRLQQHLTRLKESSKIIGLDGMEKWSLPKFRQVVSQLVRVNNIKKDVFVRVSLHVDEKLPGTRSHGLHTVLSMFAYDAEPILSPKGARLKTSVWRRIPDDAIPSRAKVNGAYVNSVLAKQDALDSGYDDCIFLDDSGHVCELSAANIFLVRGGTLITPDITSDLLEGINRRTVLELAKQLKMPVQERRVDLTELYIADEVFASGTSAYIAPVVEVDARQVADGRPGPITARLQKLHYQILHGDSRSHKNWLTYL